MKTHVMYECNRCGKTSRNPNDIELCEAQHMGLSNLDDYLHWQFLNSRAASRTSDLSRTNNERLRQLEEKAYAELLAFEKSHNMITK